MRQLRLCVSMAALLLSPCCLAQTQANPAALSFRLDPATTSIHWTLGATAHTVHGTFRLKSGELQIDPATGSASGLLVVDATSGESGDGARDRRMHRDILESSQYPTITFRPTHLTGKIDPDAPGPVTLAGVLTLQGKDHPLQLAVTLHRTGDALSAETRFDVPYVAWGMKDPSTFIFRVEKQVHIDVSATAIPAVTAR